MIRCNICVVKLGIYILSLFEVWYQHFIMQNHTQATGAHMMINNFTQRLEIVYK